MYSIFLSVSLTYKRAEPLPSGQTKPPQVVIFFSRLIILLWILSGAAAIPFAVFSKVNYVK